MGKKTITRRPEQPELAPLLFMFFLSGASGLLYQTLWVRQFGNIFGNTVHSAALVTAVFMLGLGFGGYFGGRWADRARGPRRLIVAYGCAELVIALLGALIALALPQLEALSSAVSSYQPAANGWNELTPGSYLFRHLTALALLAPITAVMGATLTILIREIVGARTADAGWKTGLLYGVNTGGAALACLVVDLYCVPTIGVRGTEAAAVALNLAAGLMALALGFSRPGSRAQTQRPPAARALLTPELAAASAAIFFSGLAAMGQEIVWFRFISGAVSERRSAFSLLLFTLLLSMWAGSTAAGFLHRKFGRPFLSYGLSQAFFVLSTLALLVGYDPANASSELGRIWSLVAIPAFFLGFAFPLASACAQKNETVIGQSAGLLYLANTVGAVLGSVAAGFFFLPAFGMQGAVAACSFGSVLAIIALAWGSRTERDRLSSVVLVGALTAVLASQLLWRELPANVLALKLFGRQDVRSRLLALSEGLTETVGVAETPDGSARVLFTNGHVMSGTLPGVQRYMRAFTHVPLLQLESPKTALVICFGAGNTLHSASLHASLERLDLADLSTTILGHASDFARWNHDVLKDPRVHVYVNDGRQHLRMQPESTYDLITLEPPPIANAGVSSLYSREFYELARSRLKTGGFLTQWVPAYQVPSQVLLSMIRAFVDVFPGAVLLSGYRSHFILMGRKGLRPEIDPVALKARLEREPLVQSDLKEVNLASPTEFVGAFAADGATLAKATRNARPLTDDFPLMEYPEALADPPGPSRGLLPPGLVDVSQVGAWCPTCHVQGKPVALVKDLDAYLAFLGGYYASPTLLYQGGAPPGQSPKLTLSPAAEQNLASLLKWSGYIRMVFAPARDLRR